MLPVIALVGRPNVGKSTLFNLLTGTRDALVADQPGLTRDRQYGYGKLGAIPYLVVDTGGLVDDAQGVEQLMARQTLRAIEDADRVLFLVDARAGSTPSDHHIARNLRRLGKQVIVVANKAEGLDATSAAAEFYPLGLGDPQPISAVRGDGVRALMERALEDVQATMPADAAGPDDIRVAVIGRPNVGKSTLINRLLGEDRLIAFDQPGTTRDAVHVPFERDGHRYLLIDTAGVRRRARVEEAVEKFSIVKALQAVDTANVVIGVIDAHDTVAEQDASLFGLVAERGRALVIAVNKWDGIPADKRDEIRAGLDLRLPFLDFAPIHFISALHGTGVGELMRAVHRAYEASMREMPTPELTRVLESAVQQHQPPLVRGRRIKLRYAHQGGRNPPIIVVHGNQVQHVPDAYRRYLSNVFRRNFNLEGTPVRVEFRSDENPFKGKRNPLTPRQARSRRRLLRRVKR
ncbi:GTPase Der [Steroidobacter denitrificans]|uniref:GTPase Der n=1 Tax=Steroidobacter denitrificans TaxID=465721 RepID=A0A127F8L9_STEDE|nr:ribosome biogenesis GTPase Der [Steroidobacter denitrificans]AMN46776.1 GTPase Der [Steroidobacter denitrificans]